MNVAMDILKRGSMGIASESATYPSTIYFLMMSVIVLESRILFSFFLVLSSKHMLVTNLLEMIHIKVLVERIEALHAQLLIHQEVSWPSHSKVMAELVAPEFSNINERFFIRYEIFTYSVPCCMVNQILVHVVKLRLVKPASFNLHLINFVNINSLLMMLSVIQTCFFRLSILSSSLVSQQPLSSLARMHYNLRIDPLRLAHQIHLHSQTLTSSSRRVERMHLLCRSYFYI